MPTPSVLASFLPQEAPPLGDGPDLTGYLLVCAGLIGGIGLLAFAFRRLFGSALRQRAAKRSLSVLDVLPLGGRRRIAVVRCYDRTFALGLGEREVSLIAELDLEESPAEVVERFPPRRGETFSGELAAAVPTPPPGRGRADATREAVERGLAERLQREGVVG